MLSVLVVILAVAGVGVRAWQELSEPTAWSYWKDAYLEPSLSASVMRIGPPGDVRTVLAVSGAIGAAAAQWFREQVNDAGLKPGDMVLLSSPGGVVDQGVIMGEVIRARGLTTAVGVIDAQNRIRPSYCASACVFVYAGGTARMGVSGSRLGVHQFSRPTRTARSTMSDDDVVAQTQRITGRILAFMTRMGVSPAILQSMTDSKDITWLTAPQAADLRLVTAPYVAP